MGPICEACGGVGQIGEQACGKCDGVGRPENVRASSGEAKEAKKASENPETVGAAHVAEAVAPGAETKQTDRNVGSGNDAVSGVPRHDPSGIGPGERLPARDLEQAVPDPLLSDCCDNWQDEMPEWEILGADECGPILEPAKAASQSPHVTREQADRIVTLIGQGWDPDTIFERVGVAIIPG